MQCFCVQRNMNVFVSPPPPNQSLHGWYPASMCADDRSLCADDPVSLCADDSFAMCADDPLTNSNVQTLKEVRSIHIKSRRVWVGISDPTAPHRKLDEEALGALSVWSQLLVSTPFLLSMCPPSQLPVQATTDAMASADIVGIGGAVFFNDGSMVWFQFQIR